MILSKDDINPKEWEGEGRQRDAQTMLMADLWGRALCFNLEQEINLSGAGYKEYLMTSTQFFYCRKDEKENLIDKLRQAVLEGDHLNYIYGKSLQRFGEWEKFADLVAAKINAGADRRTLAMIWEAYDRMMMKLIPWFYIPWYVTEENLLTDRVALRLKNHAAAIGKHTDLANALMVLVFPTKEAVFQMEQKDFFELVKLAAEKTGWKSDKNFVRRAKEYLIKYSWTKTFIILPIEPLAIEELVSRVDVALTNNSLADYKKQAERKRENTALAAALMEEIKSDKKLVALIEWSRTFAWLLTSTVERLLIACAKLIPFYKALAEEIGVPYSDWVNLTSQEIKDVLAGKSVKIGEIKKRKVGYAFLMKDREEMICAGKEGKDLVAWIDENIGLSEETKEIKGRSAMPGLVRGKVRIALRPVDAHALETGEILVCSMTSPDYVPSMKRAGAIVTDEGGLLSHAAIISRELGKPCVIATKIASKVLHDGDEVEVDAEKGIIKIIKTKN